jgi:hypothetical protein
MLQYEALSEWRGLREMSVRWRSVAFSRTGDPGSGELQTLL